MIYTLIIIATITRFGTVGGAGIAIDHIHFESKTACDEAAGQVLTEFDGADAFCVAGAKP